MSLAAIFVFGGRFFFRTPRRQSSPFLRLPGREQRGSASSPRVSRTFSFRCYCGPHPPSLPPFLHVSSHSRVTGGRGQVHRALSPAVPMLGPPARRRPGSADAQSPTRACGLRRLGHGRVSSAAPGSDPDRVRRGSRRRRHGPLPGLRPRTLLTWTWAPRPPTRALGNSSGNPPFHAAHGPPA